MRRMLPLIITLCVLSVSALAVTAPQQPAKTASSTASSAAPTVDEVLKAVRSDLQGNRADIIAKNVTLTAEQAAKFWPVFEAYQKEQNAVMDEQLKGLQKYVDSYETLDDAAALALIKAHLDRDAKMVALRQKWLGDFQKVLPTKLAVRVMQIDRRLGLVHQIEFASQIPLAY